MAIVASRSSSNNSIREKDLFIHHFLTIKSIHDDIDLLEYLSLAVVNPNEIALILCQNIENVFAWSKYINLERFRVQCIFSPDEFSTASSSIIITSREIFEKTNLCNHPLSFVVFYFSDATKLKINDDDANRRVPMIIATTTKEESLNLPNEIAKYKRLDTSMRDFLAQNGNMYDLFENHRLSDGIQTPLCIGYFDQNNTTFWNNRPFCFDVNITNKTTYNSELKNDFYDPRTLIIWPDNYDLVKSNPTFVHTSEVVIFCLPIDLASFDMIDDIRSFSKNKICWPSVHTICSSSSNDNNKNLEYIFEVLARTNLHYNSMSFAYNNRLINLSPTRVKKIWICVLN